MASESKLGRAGARRHLHWLVAWAHLGVLWSFAVAKPLFDVLDGSPEFFVARENTSADIILFAVALTLVPPTVLILAELLVSRFRRVRAGLHFAFIAVLAGALVLQILKSFSGGSSAVLIPLAAAGGVAAAIAYLRFEAVRSVLTVLSPVPLVVLVIFLLFSPVSKLVLPQDGASASAVSPDASVPVVWVTFDELSGESLLGPDLRIDRSRYPNFARLAGESTWYRNATTVADFTSEALPAMLTGNRPAKGDLPIESDHPDNLFSFLSRYDINAQEPVTDLCPGDRCEEADPQSTAKRLKDLASDLTVVSLRKLLPEDLGDRLPAVDQAFSGFGERSGTGGDTPPSRALQNRPGNFARFLRGIGRDADQPTLDFLHLELPHIPWNFLPSGQEYVTDTEGVPGTANDLWAEDTRLVRQGEQRYLLQLAYVDRMLGRLLGRLRATDAYDRSLVVVTADHGVAFEPGYSRRAVATENLHDVATVPLFIKAPGQRKGRIEDAPARTIDILPTIADYVGSRLPARVDGRSLGRRQGAPSPPVRIYAKYGAPFELPFDRFLRERDREVRDNAEVFGAGDGGAGVFAPGHAGELVGRPVASLRAAEPFPARAELEDPRVFASVDTGAPVLPAFISGSIMGTDPGPSRPLALSVNGRIASITTTFPSGGGAAFEAFLDPTLLRDGANRIDAYALSRSGGSWRTAALGVIKSRKTGSPGTTATTG